MPLTLWSRKSSLAISFNPSFTLLSVLASSPAARLPARASFNWTATLCVDCPGNTLERGLRLPTHRPSPSSRDTRIPLIAMLQRLQLPPRPCPFLRKDARVVAALVSFSPQRPAGYLSLLLSLLLTVSICSWIPLILAFPERGSRFPSFSASAIQVRFFPACQHGRCLGRFCYSLISFHRFSLTSSSGSTRIRHI